MMRRNRTRTETGGHDALMPILASVVGIVIVAVVLVGARLRASQASADVEQSAASELDRRRGAAGGLEDEIHDLNDQARKVSFLAAERYAQRGALAAEMAAGEKILAEHRAKLDDEARRQFDLAHDIAQARSELARLTAAQSDAKSKPGRSVQIQNYPNPISRVVDGKEMHFQLKDGRIVAVPWDDLMNKLKSVFAEKIWRLKEQDEFTDTLGPEDGFLLRYTMERQEMNAETAQMVGHGGTVIQLSMAQFLPVKDNLGETIEQALAPTSAFHQALSDLRPGDWTCTLWVYPDSYDLFREIRKDLYQRGFSIAGRPITPDMVIGASPNGSKSAAE
jgi:uncharacterized membrane protein